MPKVRSVSGSKSSDIPVVRSRLFMTEVMNGNSLPNLLRENGTELVPDDGTSTTRKEAGKHAPIVSVNDLAKGNINGDTVRITIGHHLTNEPTMCCDTMEGREEEMSEADFELSINQTRHGVKGGCTMDVVRLGKETFMQAKPLLRDYYLNLEQERTIYHLSGARGHAYQMDKHILPLDTSPKFAKAMINCVTPPTHCRHFWGGDGERKSFDGEAASAISASDILTLESIAALKAAMDEATHPLMPVRWGENDQGDPMYVLLVSPRQWMTMQKTADAKQFQQLIAMALARANGCGNHPIFKGNCLMFEDILVKKVDRLVSFLPGKPIEVSNDDDCASTHIEYMPIDNRFAVHRAVLLGGQALAEAYGSVADAGGQTLGKLNFKFFTEAYDGDDKHRTHIKWMSGMKKIRFPSKSGRVYDRGVAVLDTAVPLNASDRY